MSPIFANAQELLIDYLRAEFALRSDPVLDGVVVGEGVPPDRPERLVVVRRSGGPAEWPIWDLPRIDFMHWASTEYEAQAMANVTRALIMYDVKGRVLGGHTIHRVREFSGPVKYQDPAGSAVPIVMFTTEIAIRVI